MQLHSLPKISGHRRKAKRLGRGYGSGKGGHTVGRGQKGQKARSKVKSWFEGGQKPLIHRLPYKKGFKRRASDQVVINLGRLNKIYSDGELVSLLSLQEKGVTKQIPHAGVKILGQGELTKKLKFSDELSFSEAAAKKCGINLTY